MKKSMFLVITFVFLSCRSIDVNIFPDSYDVQLGAQFTEEIAKNPKEYPMMAGHQDIRGYISGIGNKILASPAVKKRSSFAWKFEVIQDDQTINAFCTPGGNIYVYTGLMKFIDDEATLAGIIAHEVAHAEMRHSTRRITGQLVLQLGAGIAVELLLGKDAATWQKIVVPLVANLLVTGIALYNSREDEYEADELSFKYLSSTEYYPAAIKGFFTKVMDKKQSSGGAFDKFVNNLFSTHPLPPDRLTNMDRLIKQGNYANPNEGNLFASKYQRVKSSLP